MKPLPPDNTTTASEAYLATLCERTFLRLWSYPGLYQDKGKGRTGHGKELCDLLVVFGEDVIIFSDKDCVLRLEPTPDTGWSRWYRRAVIDAAKQVVGAERWLKNNPSRVFLDRACTERMPIAMPASPRVHRIVTCRGAAGTSLETFGGRGSLVVTNAHLEACATRPLHLGAVDDEGRTFHVLDEVALDALVETFDTAADLCEYLAAREQLLRDHEHVIAAGEEELIAFYLRNYSEEQKRHCFRVEVGASSATEQPTAVSIGAGYWHEWRSSKARASKIAADQVSYAWDRLIDKFAFHMLTETQDYATPGGVLQLEITARWMAREPRVRRRMLARALVGILESDEPGTLRRRLILPSHTGDPHWVLCMFPKPPYLRADQYREGRRAVLESLCMVVKHVRPEALDIVGIAVGPSLHEMSEDLISFDAREWDDALAARAAELHRVTGFFTSEPEMAVEYEFPAYAPTADAEGTEGT